MVLTLPPSLSPSRSILPLFWLQGLLFWSYACFLAGKTPGAYALRNVSVTQGSPSIRYSGEWGLVNDSRSVGGVHRLALRPNATAEFTFTGVAVYYMSPKWPYQIRSNVSLDGARGVVLDLQDHTNDTEQPRSSPATVDAGIIAQGIWRNLTNGEHTLRVSVPAGAQGAVVDNFLVTEDDDPLVPSTTSSSSSTHSTSSATSTRTSDSPLITAEPILSDDPEGVTTITSTHTTIEDLGTLTQTVIVIEITASSRPAQGDTRNLEGEHTSSQNKRLAIGFGVAFGVVLILAIFGGRYWYVRRNHILHGRPVSETGTPLPRGRGGSSREAMAQRRDSYDGTFMRPHTQREPFAEDYTPADYPRAI